jgi:hypothetical protein
MYEILEMRSWGGGVVVVVLIRFMAFDWKE